MRTRTLALTALVLWAITTVTSAIFFIRGQAVLSPDSRKVILLKPDEQGLIMTEMRGMLASLHSIVAGLAQNSMQEVATAAHAVGMAGVVDGSPSLTAKLPLEFKQMDLDIHKGFDGLAALAETNASPAIIIARLEVQLSACLACHSIYRLQTAKRPIFPIDIR